MAKIDTLFMTQTAEKPYPLGLHLYTGSPHKASGVTSGNTRGKWNDIIFLINLGKPRGVALML